MTREMPRHMLRAQSMLVHVQFVTLMQPIPAAGADSRVQAVVRGQPELGAALLCILFPARPVWQRGALEVGLAQPA
jgi:hypothetical protein